MALFPTDIVSDRNGINTAGLMVALILFVSVAGIAAAFYKISAPSVLNSSKSISQKHPTMPIATMHLRESATSTFYRDSATENSITETAQEDNPKVVTSARRAERIESSKANEPKTVSNNVPIHEPAPRKKKTTEVSVTAGPGVDVSSLVSADDFARDKTIPAPMPAGVEKVSAREIGNTAINWYSVRLGFTDSKTRAEVLRDVLAGQGFPEAKTVQSKDGTYHVNAGDFRFRHQAESAVKTLEEKTGIPSKIYEKTVAE